jgi:hypothetical protein
LRILALDEVEGALGAPVDGRSAGIWLIHALSDILCVGVFAAEVD